MQKQNLGASVVDLCRARKLCVATAESCTGGLVAAALTDVVGASAVFVGGIVAYANDVKQRLLHVPAGTLDHHGAVSAQTARAMAEGALAALQADVAVSTTGIAGPGGGSADKPVGLVYIAVATPSGTLCREHRFGALGREAVRRETVEQALSLVLETLENTAA
jgi:nicotinamide-nucleotide amidase